MPWICALPFLTALGASAVVVAIYLELAVKDKLTVFDVGLCSYIFCSLAYTSWTLLSFTTSLFLEEQGNAEWNGHPFQALGIFLTVSFSFFGICLSIGVRWPEIPASSTDGSDLKVFIRILYGITLALVFFQIMTTVILVSIHSTGVHHGPGYSKSESEVCTPDWINTDNVTGLHYAFRGRLFGQPLVEEQVKSALYAFFNDPNPAKPMVLSFHGRTGTGKNFVSRLIAESVYMNGLQSKFVHLKVPTRDYIDSSKLDSYKDTLQREIESSISECPRQLLIFDEVENFPAGLLDVIKPYIDYSDTVKGVDFKKAVFIFLSNIGGAEITNITLNHNASRESIRISNVEKVIEKALFNKNDTGLYRSGLLDSHLISHFIPFLPLERQHVELCVKEEVMRMGLPSLPDKVVQEVLDDLQFWPEDTKKYAVKGCKNVQEKVALASVAFTQHFKKRDEF